MKRIREVLLNEYIGAITIGLLLVQAVGGMVSVVVQPFAFYWTRPRTRESIFGSSSSDYAWSSHLVPLFVSIALYLLAAFLLLYWLYLRPAPKADETTNGDSQPTSPDEPAQS